MFEYKNFLISKIKFIHFVREIMQKYLNENLCIQFVILNVLQKIIKMFFFSFFFNMCIIFSHYFTIAD